MFTGIVTATLPLQSQAPLPGQVGVRVRLGRPALWDDVVVGESIALNGACMTVSEQTPDFFAFDLSPETLAKTNLGELKPGQAVNAERALKVSDRLSGHWVQGHVDGVGRLLHSRTLGDCHELTFLLPYTLGRLCVEKGSITIDGVSLTINSAVSALKSDGVEVSVMIIPHTWNSTTLSQLAVGASVNVETDILAKYMEKLCQR